MRVCVVAEPQRERIAARFDLAALCRSSSFFACASSSGNNDDELVARKEATNQLTKHNASANERIEAHKSRRTHICCSASLELDSADSYKRSVRAAAATAAARATSLMFQLISNKICARLFAQP